MNTAAMETTYKQRWEAELPGCLQLLRSYRQGAHYSLACPRCGHHTVDTRWGSIMLRQNGESILEPCLYFECTVCDFRRRVQVEAVDQQGDA